MCIRDSCYVVPKWTVLGLRPSPTPLPGASPDSTRLRIPWVTIFAFWLTRGRRRDGRVAPRPSRRRPRVSQKANIVTHGMRSRVESGEAPGRGVGLGLNPNTVHLAGAQELVHILSGAYGIVPAPEHFVGSEVELTH